jgi:hypothetical protein
MVVATVALATSGIGRLAVRDARSQAEQRQAQLAARSGIEYALNWLNTHSDWRTRLTSGADVGPVTFGAGRFTWRVTDEDGLLANDARDHAVLRAVGYAGAARSALEVTIEPAGRGLTCLDSAVHAAGAVTFGAGGCVLRNGEVTSELGTSPFLTTPPRESPGNDAFDYYVSRGTEIPLASVPNSLGKRRINTRLFSRGLNPFGETNPHGIYWINCQGQAVDLKWTRSLGTLVLLNAGAGTAIEDVAIYQPEAPNHPSLLVQGDLTIDLTTNAVPLLGILASTQLKESGLFNYNPVGIPYNGETDNDKSDSRPATLDGLVYVTGTVTVSDDAVIRGALVAGSVVVSANKKLTVEYRPYAKNYPPPGFTAGSGVRPLPGSWREVGL